MSLYIDFIVLLQVKVIRMMFLDNIDLTYYMTKFREVLKKIYDNSFKKNKLYTEQKNNLLKIKRVHVLDLDSKERIRMGG